MIVNEWGFIFLESGIIQAGKISEYYLAGEPVIRVELPALHGPSFYEYHKMNSIKGIRVSSQQECEKLYPNICKLNIALKTAKAA